MKVLYQISNYNNKINRKKDYKGNIKKLYIKRNILINLLELVIIVISFPIFFSEEFRYKLITLQFDSEIKLTIKGKGNQYILNKGIPKNVDFDGPIPDKIFINGDSQIINNSMLYYLSEEYNNITLIWDSPLNSTSLMFCEVSNITKIIVSHFDSTRLKEMNNMFFNVKLLTSVDLSNLDTSLVIDFGGLFYGCTSLISLDLSNFKTSNAKYLYNMFIYCKSIKSLDLSNFNTSKVEKMYDMFYGCESLIYLNLKSFTEQKLNEIKLMFYGIGKNLTYCIDKDKAPQIYAEIQKISTNNNCLDTCFLQPAILLINQNKCISCYAQNFLYKYNNECVQSCPKRTRISLYNNYSCIDLHCQNYYNYDETDCLEEIPESILFKDSDLKTTDKCNYYYSGKCFSECINDTNNNLICNDLLDQNCTKYLIYNVIQDSCIYCFNGTVYYPIYNQSIVNSDTFAYCNKSLEGYFLDYDKTYKPCFNTCKTCSNKGNETNNNCIKCKDNYRLLNDSKNNVNNCYEECDKKYYYFDLLNKYHCTDDCPIGYKLIKEKNKCIDNCSKDDDYPYELNNSCLRECPAYHYEFNNICLKVPDSVVDSNLNILNSDCVVHSNLNIISSDSAVNINIQKINSDKCC